MSTVDRVLGTIDQFFEMPALIGGYNSQPVNRFNCHALIVIHPLKTADWQSKARNNKYLKTRECLKTYC